MILNWKLYTESRKAATKESTVANTLGLPTKNIHKLIDDGTIAALTFTTMGGDVKNLFRPRHMPSQDGSESSVVFGNAFNQRGLVGPFKIDISQGRFCGVLSEADMEAFELDKPNAIPAPIVAANNLGEGNYYLVAAPKAMPGHFQQQFPEGQLSEVQGTLETNGIALSIWIALLASVDSQPKVDKIRAIVENPTIQADLENFIAHGSAHVDLTGPNLVVNWETLECYPDQFNELKSVFASSTESSVAAPAARQELTTSKDRHEQLTANKGMIKLKIPMVSVSIKDGKVDASTAKRPVTTLALDEIERMPPSGMKEGFSDTVRCYLAENAKSINPTNIMDNSSLSYIPLPICDNIVKGNWTQDPVTQVDVDSQLNTFSMFTFRAQNPDDKLVQTYLNEETSTRAQNKTDGASSKKLRELLAAFVNMDDSFASKCLVNSRHAMGTLFDFETMATEGNRALFDNVAIQLICWFMLQSTNKFPQWRVDTGEKMDHLGALLSQWGELFFVACGKLANSLHNISVFSDPDGDVTTLDFSVIDDFLKDFAIFKDDVTSKQRTRSAHNAIPALFLAANKQSRQDDDASPRQPNQEREDRNVRDNHTSRQQRPPRDQHDGSGSGSGQGTPKRQKPSPSGSGSSVGMSPEENGILCLREGVSLNEGFPSGFPACKKFVTRGFICLFGDNCSAAHWSKLEKLSTHNKTRWIEHLRANPVAFFNQWKIGKFLKKDPELQGLIGPPSSPPPRE